MYVEMIGTVKEIVSRFSLKPKNKIRTSLRVNSVTITRTNG
jgi:hypothetical protein